MCLENTLKALSSLRFPLLLLQLQKPVVKNHPSIFIRKRQRPLCSTFLSGVTQALCNCLAVRDMKRGEGRMHSEDPSFLRKEIWLTCFLKWAAFQRAQGNSEHQYQVKAFRATRTQMETAVATENQYSNYQPCVHRLHYWWLQCWIGCHMPKPPFTAWLAHSIIYNTI